MRGKYLVPAAQWRRGVTATERIGRLLKDWEDRGREFRSQGENPPDAEPRQGKARRRAR